MTIIALRSSENFSCLKRLISQK